MAWIPRVSRELGGLCIRSSAPFFFSMCVFVCVHRPLGMSHGRRGGGGTPTGHPLPPPSTRPSLFQAGAAGRRRDGCGRDAGDGVWREAAAPWEGRRELTR